MDNKGLTITMIFKAQSLNYGEAIGNISELKKLSRGDGSTYTFASRQALRYDIVRLGNKMFRWNLEVVDKSKGTIQFKDDLTIKDSQEMEPKKVFITHIEEVFQLTIEQLNNEVKKHYKDYNIEFAKDGHIIEL